MLISSACLDSTTFAQYRDYTYVSDSHSIITTLSRLFENDWLYSAQPNQSFPTFNPTPANTQRNLIIAPVDASSQLVSFIQKAERALDMTSELLGNPTLESELSAAAAKGVRVRLIAPEIVNDATPEIQALQISSLNQLESGRCPHTCHEPTGNQRTSLYARPYGCG